MRQHHRREFLKFERHAGRWITAAASGNAGDAWVIEKYFVVTGTNDAAFAYQACCPAQGGVMETTGS